MGSGGINIEKAKEVLKAEDKFDKATERARIKEKHKEDKKKLKEENRTKVNFDEEGDVVREATKQKLSKEGKEYEEDEADRIGGGINIEKAKEVLKAEDKFDKATERARIKEKHKEDKKKLKCDVDI